MSHPEQRAFIAAVRRRFPGFFSNSRVLEIGSLDINGTVRDFFVDCDYIGVDLGPGPGVDIVMAGEDLDFADGSFDLCISAECFEHNPAWRETFMNMIRMSGGLVVVTAATDGRAEHGTKSTTPGDSPFTSELHDYYANIGVDDLMSLGLDRLFVKWEVSTNASSHDVYFWGAVRPKATDQLHSALVPSTPAVSWITAADDAIIQRDRLVRHQLDGVTRDLDRLSQELRAMQESRIWRYTSPWRALRARLRLTIGPKAQSQ